MCGDAGRQKESKGFIPKNYPICMLGSFGRMSVEDLDHVFSFDRHDVLRSLNRQFLFASVVVIIFKSLTRSSATAELPRDALC